MLKAYPRHSVDISRKEYGEILSRIFSFYISKGEASKDFEHAFREYVGVPYAVSIPSARLGLFLIFKHFALPEGSEIIISPFTHWSIFSVIKACRLKPVFVDIDESTFNIDPAAVKKVITRNTKILILTHMWGQPCDMDPFLELKKEFGIKIIEDCAMACGATYKGRQTGSFTDASIFSFGKAKAIATFGGGMLCTNDSGIYEEAQRSTAAFRYEHPVSLASNLFSSVVANILTRPRLFFLSIYPIMSAFNLKDPYNPMEHKRDAAVFADHVPEQWKIKMSDLQAVLGMQQLRDLDIKNRRRMAHAAILNEILHGTNGIAVPLPIPGAIHTYLYYALLIKKRTSLNDIRKILLKHRVDSQLNELTTAKELAVFGADSKNYPIFHMVSENLLIIPNGIYLNHKDCRYVGTTVKRVLDSVD